MRRGLTSLLSLMLAAGTAAGTATADVVRLKVTGGSFGQGWMFMDQDGVCKVATAGHVVRGLDGAFRPTMVLDAREHEWPTDPPLVLSTDPDIAVLPIPAASSPTSCGEGRLSPIGVARRVANMTEGLIRTTGESEIRDVPVARRISAIDKSGGALFAVRPKAIGDVVRKGWSGSAVLDAGGPLGIVFEVDPEANEALAVRTDIVVGLMRAAPAIHPAPSSAGPRALPLLAVLAGSTIDPANGPNQILAAKGEWSVVPSKRTVLFTLAYAEPIRISQVTIGASVPGGIEAMEVSTKADTGQLDWTLGNYCRASADAVRETCRFLVRTVRSVRILIKTRSDQPISMGDLLLN